MTATVSNGIRELVKRFVEHSVTRSGLDRLSRAMRTARGAVLAYHNVVPTGQEIRGESALHIPRRRFEEHLDAIERSHDVVSLERLLSGEGTTERPRLAITFDDAYRGALTIGLRETARRGFPATVFVSPGLLGREVLWWDRLADGPGRIDPEIRETALTAHGGDQEAVLEWWAGKGPSESAGGAPFPEAYHLCAPAELQRAADEHPELSVGSHGWSHLCLSSCDDSTIQSELERSARWLRPRFGSSYVRCVSYPYGRYSSAATACAREWYRWGLRIDGGLVPESGGGEDDYRVPRINVPSGLSARGLLVRLSGLL